jgi:hypothetical protein
VVSEASDRVVVKGRMLVSVPISTLAAEPRALQAAAAATADATPMGVTQTFEAPAPLPVSSRQTLAGQQLSPPTQVFSPPAQQQYPAPQPMVRVAAAATPRKKNFMAPLATAAAVVTMVGVGSVYFANRTSPEIAMSRPLATPPQEIPSAAPPKPALTVSLPGTYGLQSNLPNIAPIRSTMEIRRISDDVFTFQTVLAGDVGGVPFRHQYAGQIEKTGPVWYVNTARAADRTIAPGRVQNEIAFENNILTFRPTNGPVMAWRKR